jgi:hypothetical protein
MAIIGEELRGYVRRQITARQTLHGSGVGHTGNLRTDKQINLLNSNTSWIKLASGVSISESNRLTELNIDPKFIGMGLAKNNILFSGTSKLINGQLEQREGFLPREDNSSYTYGSFGFSPMPGIISADIKTLTRGSLKKATVKLTANNKQQFDIIDLLYMRLGYTVLLEWGNSIYTTTGGDKKTLGNTLIEDKFFESSGNDSYFTFLDDIEDKRDKHDGNYDALLGKISNFNWSFNSDGSYSIGLTIISLGDVIESLKSNLSVDKVTNEFLKRIIPQSTSTESNVVDIIDGGASGTVNNSKNVEIALKFFIDEKKYSASKAIGIIAALMGESGPNLNPTAVNSKSKAYGIAQWLGKRAENQILVAKKLGKNKSDLKAQLEFIHLELTPKSGYTDTIADDYILKANTKEEYLAAMATYERWSYPVKLFYANGKNYNNVYPIILAEINKGNSPDSSLNKRIKYLADVKATWNKLYNP